MTYKGVIFDFNGTLLWDTGLHNQAWDIFLERYHMPLSDQQKNEIIHGKNNHLIFETLFSRKMTLEESGKYINEKERIYRDLCVESGIGFAPGALEFIDFLKKHNIKCAIATASGKENIDFYIDHFKLGSVIDVKNITYDNNMIRSKPDPEIFEIAIRKLGLKSQEVIIFEDSLAGITSALRSKAGKVFIVNSMNGKFDQFDLDIITDFNQVNRELFG